MKIGVISDIHSNYDALESVIKEFEKQNVDKMICLGDFIGLGIYPEKCTNYLMENKKKFLAIIKGNHERYLTEGITRKNHTDNDAGPMSEGYVNAAKWNFSRLNEEEVEFIKSLQNSVKIEVEGKIILVEHYSMKDEKKYKDFVAIPTIDDIHELYDRKEADIYLFGHTHEKIYLQENGKHYINPGSLGCPGNDSFAYAGIIQIENGKIEYFQLSVKYDKQKTIDKINELKFPNYDEIIRKFYKDTFKK